MADNRVLDPKIRGQLTGGYQIPPSQDQFYGQGMSAQPTFLEKMVKMFTNPNDPLQPMAMEAPVAAMIPSARNLPVFQKMVREAFERIHGAFPEAPDAFKNAASFFETRYPRISGLVSGVQPTTGEGAFLDPDNVVNIGQYGAHNPPLVEKIMDQVQSYGHEATHAINNARRPGVVEEADNIRRKLGLHLPENAGDYAWYYRPQNKALVDALYNSADEQLAFRGEATAGSAYQKYLDLFKK